MPEEKQAEFESPDFDKIKGTPLGKAAGAYLAKKQSLEEIKLEIEHITKDVITEMRKEGKNALRVVIAGERHVFKIVEQKEKLNVKKETRQPKKKETEPEA